MQGRSQTSEQDEASFERRKRGQLEGSRGSCPPDNFEIYLPSNALLSIFRGIFSSEKSVLGKCRSSLFVAERYWFQFNDYLHFKVIPSMVKEPAIDFR